MGAKKRSDYAKLNWGMIRAVFNKLGGMSGAKQFLCDETKVVTSAELDVLRRHLRAFGRSVALFKTVTTGRYASIDALVSDLTEAGSVSGPARSYLNIQSISQVRNLVALSTYQLVGKLDLATFAEIHSGAKRLGLEMCEPEEAALLRLRYRDQPAYEVIRVVVGTETGSLLFEVSNIGGLLLDCLASYPELKYPADQKWVFRRPE